MRHSHPFFFVLLVLPLLLLLVSSHGDLSHSLRLELHRRPSAAPIAIASRIDHLRAIARSDELRQGVIAAAIARRRRACEAPAPAPAPAAAAQGPESAFAMPLGSGAYTGTGEYFVRFRVGTPAQRFVLVADTGSDLTWVKCRLRRRRRRSRSRSGSRSRSRSRSRPAHGGGGDRGGGGARVFRPENSSSWDPIRCSSEMCKTSLPFSLAACPTPTSPCAYDYGYLDGSSAEGVFASESATITLAGGKRTKLRGLIVGCTTSSAGSSIRASDGVLGLGYSNVSFAARAAARFGGRFSYCLVDHLSPHNASSFLTFGPNPALSHSHSQSTALLLGLQPYYAVSVSSISVDGEPLRIPDSVWDVARGGGTIIDSGASLMLLAEPAYKAVTAALSRRLQNLPRVSIDPFEYCYNWTAAGALASAAAAALPKFAVHFAGGALLEPPAKSYVIDVEDGVKCIGIMSVPWPGQSIIGNILQQEHLWEFDLKNRRLRFKRSKCA